MGKREPLRIKLTLRKRPESDIITPNPRHKMNGGRGLLPPKISTCLTEREPAVFIKILVGGMYGTTYSGNEIHHQGIPWRQGVG
jgi:hypothetical protein